jgi:hypothetical protein
VRWTTLPSTRRIHAPSPFKHYRAEKGLDEVGSWLISNKTAQREELPKLIESYCQVWNKRLIPLKTNHTCELVLHCCCPSTNQFTAWKFGDPSNKIFVYDVWSRATRIWTADIFRKQPRKGWGDDGIAKPRGSIAPPWDRGYIATSLEWKESGSGWERRWICGKVNGGGGGRFVRKINEGCNCFRTLAEPKSKFIIMLSQSCFWNKEPSDPNNKIDVWFGRLS